MSGLLARIRRPFGGTRERSGRTGPTAFAFAGSLVGLSSTGLSRSAGISTRPGTTSAIDGPLIAVVVALLLMGTIMVYSASISSLAAVSTSD